MMTGQLKALATLAEDLGLAPSIHTGQLTITYNSTSGGFDILFWPIGPQADK